MRGFPYFAQKLGVSETRIYSIATFYEIFSIEIKCKYVTKICEYTDVLPAASPWLIILNRASVQKDCMMQTSCSAYAAQNKIRL